MIAVDTNLLVYSIREDAPFHRSAARILRTLAEGEAPWAVPWPCFVEFVGIVSHPRIYSPPTPLADALQQVRNWKGSPMLRVLTENSLFWEHFSAAAWEGRATGSKVHDARIAALCRANAVTELWSADRDFSRFPGLVVRNPLTAPIP